MEQHPVPQNVTTFQFRLIGDMTLKQFGYLAGGAILAYIFYKLPLPFFFTWPLALLAAATGIGLAFVPIEERPMDVWVLSFFKSIYSPTQYVWTKRRPGADQPLAGAQPPTTPTATQTAMPTKKTDILQNIFAPASPAGGPTAPASASPTKRANPLDWFFAMLTPKPGPKATPPPPASGAPPKLTDRMDFAPPPSVVQTQKTIDEAAQKETEIEGRVKHLQEELAAPQADDRVRDLQKQLADLMGQHQKMEDELRLLRQHTPAQPVTDTPSPASAPPATTKSVATPRPITPEPSDGGRATVQIITPDRAVKVGLPRLTTFPNVVTGIVKDSEQNLLPGVLITVKDKDGMPLRALKTNRLGQFAASTPLPNGTYLVEVEDPRLRFAFDRAQITLNGSIVPALEIFAKSQKEITRAKLEKELFGNKT